MAKKLKIRVRGDDGVTRVIVGNLGTRDEAKQSYMMEVSESFLETLVTMFQTGQRGKVTVVVEDE